MVYTVKIIKADSGKRMCTLEKLPSNSTVSDVKDCLAAKYSLYYPDRQSYRVTIERRRN